MKELTTGNKPKPIQPTAVFTAKEWHHKEKAYILKGMYSNGIQFNPNVSDLWREMREYDYRRQPNE